MKNALIVDAKILFGKRLRELREQAGLSQESLAELSGLDRTYVSGCERGKRNSTLESIFKLSRALRVAPAQLLEPPTNSAPQDEPQGAP